MHRPRNQATCTITGSSTRLTTERQRTVARYEEWLEPWSNRYYEHQRPLREAFESKNIKKAIDAFNTHMPEMISIRNAVAELEIPTYWPTSLFTSLKNLLWGIKHHQILQIERDVALEFWDRSIRDYQVEYQELVKKLR